MAKEMEPRGKREDAAAEETGRAINTFLESLSQQSRVIFLRRYWFCDTVSEIARRYGIRERRVRMELRRARTQWADYLDKEGSLL